MITTTTAEAVEVSRIENLYAGSVHLLVPRPRPRPRDSAPPWKEVQLQEPPMTTQPSDRKIVWHQGAVGLVGRILVRVFDGEKEITREVFGAEYGERIP